jgi:hypothetical protein
MFVSYYRANYRDMTTGLIIYNNKKGGVPKA